MRGKNTIAQTVLEPLFIYNSPVKPFSGVFKKMFKEGLLGRVGEGLYCYRGIVSDLMNLFDGLFKKTASTMGAQEMIYPSTVDYDVLKKSGYFDNFSSVVQFIKPSWKKGNRGKQKRNDSSGSHEQLFSAQKALLPAVCLPCYAALQGKQISSDMVVLTTKNRIFRAESAYPTIFQMNEFDVRDIVFIGKEDRVKAALEDGTEIVKKLAEYLGFSYTLNVSNDLFYGESSYAKSLFQILTKSKVELKAFSRDLGQYIPISSMNFHKYHFTETFNIKVNGIRAVSACVGFGIQRWVLTFLNIYGTDMKKWPRKIKKMLYQ